VLPAELLEWINAGGVVGLLVAVVAGALRGWWVPGKTHERVIHERDRLLELAIASTVTTEAATEVMRSQKQTAEEIARTAAAEALARAAAEGRL
jgi:hypothetical protein